MGGLTYRTWADAVDASAATTARLSRGTPYLRNVTVMWNLPRPREGDLASRLPGVDLPAYTVSYSDARCTARRVPGVDKMRARHTPRPRKGHAERRMAP